MRPVTPPPTVYETRGVANDSEWLDADSTRARAYRAVLGVQNGQDVEAFILLHELAEEGSAEARESLSEVKLGRWSKALRLLHAVAERKA
jgi:hypothetical protein